ncbi:S-adenosyl-L-methionine-dependent methyltransferase [Dactylonectria macrodidyma]|uniref:S-adenosyl-L-methionine-dependent methyltransferase n=1 Tax=Dactylonectria macrodidyma TaxID=307937 RepID=A0A9P9ERS5_9HYPO|nr:S-adenosyl-L-methionine-dependent methyltransferase [Dactylonectria macrodidyma]
MADDTSPDPGTSQEPTGPAQSSPLEGLLEIDVGAYFVPNDEEEQTRMDLVHHIFSLILDGSLYLAPIGDHPKRVLDLGTGTGIWAIDFADDFPSAEVLGIDLSPIQPEWTPPNCAFDVDVFEAEWLYHTPFDFIRARELEGCISDDDRLFQQALHHLVPGGHIEMQTVAAPFLSDDGSAKFGKPVDCAPLWKAKLIAAGFEGVEEEIRKMPLGAWPKDPKLNEIGKFQAIQEAQAIESYTPQIFSSVLGWTQEEIQVFIAKVKNELKDPSIHLYLPVHFLWGRKPRF